MRFSATDAVFEGFRVARAHPKAVLMWAGVCLVVNTVSTLAMVGLAGPSMHYLQTMPSDPSAMPPPEAFAAMGNFMLGTLAMLLISLISYALILPAIARAVLRPEHKERGFLAFGGVELRFFGLLIIMSLAIFGTYMGGVIVVALVAGLGGIFGVLLAIPLVIGLVVLIAMVAGRFSLAGPAALMEGGLGIGRSFELTRGRVWAITGGVILTYVMMVLVLMLVFMVMAGVAAAFSGMAGVGSLFKSDMSSVGAYFSPAMIINLIPGALGGALMTGIVGGFGVDAYRQLTGAGPAQSGSYGDAPLL